MRHAELPLGYCPKNEPPPDYDKPGHHFRAWQMCRAFIALIRRTFGSPPIGSSLLIKGHDDREAAGGGPWYSVVLRFPSEHPKDKPAREYALRVQREPPARWDDDARAELGLDQRAAAPKVVPADLTARQVAALKRVYVDFDRPSDRLSLNKADAEELAKRFAAKARKEVPAPRLVALIVSLRKRGEWPCLQQEKAAKPAVSTPAPVNGVCHTDGPGKRAGAIRPAAKPATKTPKTPTPAKRRSKAAAAKPGKRAAAPAA